MLAEYELNRERNEDLFVSAGEDNVCPVHFHRKVEVMYVTSGVKNFVAAGKEVSLGEDGIFFANSYEMHGYVESAGSTQTVIVFPNRMLGNYYDCFGDKMPLGNMVRCDFMLGSLMDKLGTVEGVKERQSFVDGLLAYINENYAEDIDLESMAEHFGYSKYYFSRMFNAALGTSLTDYVSGVRLMRALDMLKRTGCTVSQAAMECGFSSLPTFYRVLKKNYNYKSVKDLL